MRARRRDKHKFAMRPGPDHPRFDLARSRCRGKYYTSRDCTRLSQGLSSVDYPVYVTLRHDMLESLLHRTRNAISRRILHEYYSASFLPYSHFFPPRFFFISAISRQDCSSAAVKLLYLLIAIHLRSPLLLFLIKKLRKLKVLRVTWGMMAMICSNPSKMHL